MTGRKKKLRPDLSETSTLALLGTVAAEALRLREENKRLTAELKAALKRPKPAGKKAAKTVTPVVTTEVVAEAAPVVVVAEKKPGPRRQALGSGLARFLGARRSS